MGIVLAGYGADYVLKSFDIEAVSMLDRLMELHPAAVLGIGLWGWRFSVDFHEHQYYDCKKERILI